MHVRRVVFVLVLLSFAGRAASQAPSDGCTTYASVDTPVSGIGAVLSIIRLPDSLDLDTVVVDDLSLAAPRLSSIKLSLSAGVPAGPPPRTVALMDVSSGGDASSMANTRFTDDAGVQFPADAAGAPFTMAFTPSQPLADLVVGNGTTAGAGGSQGSWVLRAADLRDASSNITITAWALRICPNAPAGAEDTATKPAITAQEGPSNVNTTTDARAPDTTTAHAGDDQEAAGGGLVKDLLDRLNLVSIRGAGLLPNFTSLRVGGSDTLLGRLDDRLTELLEPFNETRLARAVEGMQNAVASGSATWSVGDGLRSALNATASAVNFTGPLAARLGLDRDQDGQSQAVLQRFLNSFRDLVDAAGGDNASATTDAIANATAMQQSVAGLLGGDANVSSLPFSGSVAKLLRAVGISTDGPVLQALARNGVLASLTKVYNAVTKRPVVNTLRSSTQAVKDAATAQLRTALNDVSSAWRVKQNYDSATAQNALEYWRDRKTLASSAVADQINAYRDLVSTSGALVQEVLRRRVNDLLQTTNKLSEGVVSSLDVLSKLPQSKLRDQLAGLLNGQLLGLGNLKANTSSLGGDAVRISSSLFDAYKASDSAVRGVLATGVNAGIDVAQNRLDARLRLASSLLDKLNEGLTRASSSVKTGPIASKTLASYKSGITWLESQLESLRAAVAAIPPVKLDGALVKQAADAAGNALSSQFKSLRALGNSASGSNGASSGNNSSGSTGAGLESSSSSSNGVSSTSVQQLKASMEQLRNTLIGLKAAASSSP